MHGWVPCLYRLVVTPGMGPSVFIRSSRHRNRTAVALRAPPRDPHTGRDNRSKQSRDFHGKSFTPSRPRLAEATSIYEKGLGDMFSDGSIYRPGGMDLERVDTDEFAQVRIMNKCIKQSLLPKNGLVSEHKGSRKHLWLLFPLLFPPLSSSCRPQPDTAGFGVLRLYSFFRFSFTSSRFFPPAFSPSGACLPCLPSLLRR